MLRKFVILLALAALMAGTASAGFLPTYGIKAGANFSSVNLDELDASSRTGFVGGAFVNLAWPVFNLQGELLYTTKGFDNAKTPDNTPYDYSLHAIQIPVLLKFKLPIPAVAPSLYAGPALAFTTKAEVTGADGQTQDVKDETKSTVWSLVLGVDVTLFDKLIVDVRYDMDLNSLSKDALTDYDEDIKGRTITVMAGVAF
jgi:hypothetical protein